jgi:hypothetical protein
MKKNIKEEIAQNYPAVLSLENVRVILRISKRKAAWLLQNGYIKCVIHQKKTRNYEIKIEDLFDYIDKVERLDPSVIIPVGLFSSSTTKSHRNQSTVVAPHMIHNPLPVEFRQWLMNEWIHVDDLVLLKDIPSLIGYTEKTVQKWYQTKRLKTALSQNCLFTTKDWIIDFLIEEGYKIQNKSSIHMQLLLRYYNR